MDDRVLDAATRRLYAAPPDEFAGLRRSLVDETDDADTAKAIGRLRKPTNAARVVNALAADDPHVSDRLRDLGDRLRSAQHDLDAALLRELTEERRKSVAECAKRAFALAGVAAPAAGLRDDVLATFDAAVADPTVAERLGALQRPEHFSGFGFADDQGAPALTLVQGGRSSATKPAPAAKKQPPKINAAEQRKRKRALDDAQAHFDDADAALDTALTTEREAARDVRRRDQELKRAKARLDDARDVLDESRETLKQAKTDRREARSALDRAQRQAQR